MLSKQQNFILAELHNPEFEETSDGMEIHLDCVFCGDYRKKMYINTQGKGICFICGTKFNSVSSFLIQYEHISKKEAMERVKSLNDFASLESYNQAQTNGLFDSLLKISQGSKEQRPPKLPTNTKLLLNNFNNREAFPYFNYLKQRGLTLNDIKKYNIMYVNQGKYYYSNTELSINNSIIFPTLNGDSKLVYWNTRALPNTSYIKSINAPSDNGETYTKQSVVWNANHIKQDGNVVICEGVFNAIMADSDKYTGVATFGKQITDTQLQLIKGYKPLNYYIALDNDAYETALDLVQRLIKLGIDIHNIYFVTHSMLKYKGKDFNDLGKAKVQKILNDCKPLNNNLVFQLRLNQYI